MNLNKGIYKMRKEIGGGKSWKAVTNKILDFKLSPCFESCLYSFGYFPGIWLWFADVSEHSICSIFIGWMWSTSHPAFEDGTDRGFHKMASRNVSNTFTVAGRSAQLHEGTILKEIQYKWLYCFALLRNRVIPGTFWSYHVLSSLQLRILHHRFCVLQEIFLHTYTLTKIIVMFTIFNAFRPWIINFIASR